MIFFFWSSEFQSDTDADEVFSAQLVRLWQCLWQVVSEKRKVMAELSDFLGYRILYLPIFFFFLNSMFLSYTIICPLSFLGSSEYSLCV